MSSNLISLVFQYLTPDMMKRIASAIGIDAALAERAIGAAVPALLGGLSNVAAAPGGGAKIMSALNQVDSGMLGGLGKMLSGGQSDQVMSMGSGLLGSLLGNSGTSALAGAVSKFGGVNASQAASLTGLLAPVLLGTIKNSNPGLDASGLTSLFASQKANIASALPQGMGSVLSSLGGVDLGKTAASVQAQAGRATGAAMQGAQQAAAKGTNWLMWLIPVVIIAAALWWFLGKRPAEMVTAPAVTAPEVKAPEVKTPETKTTEVTTPAVKAPEVKAPEVKAPEVKAPEVTAPAVTDAMMIDGVDIGKDVTAMLGGLTPLLGGITDAATATAALPKITETAAQADKLSGLIGKLPADQKTRVSGMISTALPAIKAAVTKVMAVAGIPATLKPAVDGLIAKLEAMAKV